MTYAKFYVKILRKIGRPQLRRHATVRPSFRRALGPVSVRRRSAAQGCANAHTDVAQHRRTVGPIESTSTSGTISWLAADYCAHK